MNEDSTKKDSLIDLLVENKLAKIEDEKILLSNEAVILLTIVATELIKEILKKLFKKE